MRALAFLLVFAAHAAAPPLNTMIPSTFGITVFFFLSGFLITTLLRAESERTGSVSLRDFYIRRTLRIFAPLYIAYALAWLSARFVFHSDAGNRLGLWSSILYFFNYAWSLGLDARPPSGLDVVWSLCVEEHFYLLFPLLFLFFVRHRISQRTQGRILLLLCGLGLLWRVAVLTVVPLPVGWTYRATDCRFDSMLWGCLLATCNHPQFGDKPLLPARGMVPGAVFAALGLLATMLVRNTLFRESARYTVQAALLYILFFGIVARPGSLAVRALEFAPLRYLGRISYSLYLGHLFLLNRARSFFPGRALLPAVCGLLAVILYAILMRYSVELPLGRLRARFRHLRRPAVAIVPT